MACNEDLKKGDTPYPRTCADCGLGPCKKYAMQTIKNNIGNAAWVLWHTYTDGPGAHVARVYLDKARAEEDLHLLSTHPAACGEWKLDEVPLFGPH